MSDFWHDDAHIEKLKVLWNDGLSASRCAIELRSAFPGYDGQPSRNSVLSKIHRMGMSNRVTASVAQRTYVTKPRVPRAPKPVLATVNGVIQEPEPLLDEHGHRFDLEHSNGGCCLYIAGDPLVDGGLICARKRVPESSYCLEHTFICFQPAAASRMSARPAA